MNFKFPFFSKKQKIVANTKQIVDAKGRKLSDILKSGGSGGGDDKLHVRVDCIKGTFPEDSIFGAEATFSVYKTVNNISEVLPLFINMDDYSYKDVIGDVYVNNEYVTSMSFKDISMKKGVYYTSLKGPAIIWSWDIPGLKNDNTFSITNLDSESHYYDSTMNIGKCDLELMSGMLYSCKENIYIKSPIGMIPIINIDNRTLGNSIEVDTIIHTIHPDVTYLNLNDNEEYKLRLLFKITSLDDISYE